MKFQYKPSENSSSFREYLMYLGHMSDTVILYSKVIIIPLMVFIFFLLTQLVVHDQELPIVGIISLICTSILVISSIILILKLNNKRKVRNNNLYCDLESVFSFTIEDGYLTRENEFSNIKLQLNKVKEIVKLKDGLIVTSYNNSISLFIPKSSLPATSEEFIELIRSENKELIIIQEDNRLNKIIKKLCITSVVFVVLVVIVSLLI